MHAIRQYKLGGPEALLHEEVADLVPSEGRVRIAVEASGVHYLDTSLRQGFTSAVHAPQQLPMTPGREVAGRTATGILDLTPISAQDTVVVTSAAGGLGVLLIQAAREVGATVIGLVGGPDKIAIAEKRGAHLAVDYRSDGWHERLREELGGNVATVVLGPGLMARPGGLRSLEAESLERAANGSRVPLVVSTFALSDAAEAHRALESRATHGKVVLFPGGLK